MSGHIGFRSRLFEAHVQGKRDNNLLEAQMRKLEKEHRERLEVIRRSAGKVEATLPGIRRLSSKAQKLSEQLAEKMRIRRQSVGLPKQRPPHASRQMTAIGGELRGRRAVSDNRTSRDTNASERQDPLQAKVRAYLTGMKQLLAELYSAAVEEEEGLRRPAYRHFEEFWAPRKLGQKDWNRQLRIYHDRGDTLYSPPPERELAYSA